MDMFEKQDAVPVEARLQAIEAKLDAIMAHLGIGPGGGQAQGFVSNDPQGMPDVVELVRRGKLIQAIKIYRERTGVGLKEAKDAVERVR